MDQRVVISVFLCTLLHACKAIYYSPGTTYHFRYTTQFNIAERYQTWQMDRKFIYSGFVLKAEVDMTPLWEKRDDRGTFRQLCKLMVKKATLTGATLSQKSRRLTALERFPMFFMMSGNSSIHRLFAMLNDSNSVQNMKQGIISMFQVKYPKKEPNWEKSPDGTCLYTYIQKGSHIEKTRSQCWQEEFPGQYSNVEPMVGLDVDPYFTSLSIIKNDKLVASTTLSTKLFNLPIYEELGISVVSSQDIEYINETTDVQIWEGEEELVMVSRYAEANNYDMQHIVLWADFVERPCRNCQTATEVLNAKRGSLLSRDCGQSSGSEAFLALVTAMRTASAATLSAMLQHPANEEIKLTLVDAVTATQTDASHAAIMQFINFEDESMVNVCERFLLAAAFSTHPSNQLLEDLLVVFENRELSERLRRAVGVSLGAVAYTFSRQDIIADTYIKEKLVAKRTKLSVRVEESLLGALQSCGERQCHVSVLGCLANAGLENTAPALLTLAATSADMTVIEACVKALRRMPDSTFNEKVVQSLNDIFFQVQRGYDSAIRSAALTQILRSNVTEDNLRAIVMETTDPTNQEFSLYIQTRLLDLVKANPALRKRMVNIVKDMRVMNYDVFATLGKSVAFSSNIVEMSEFLAQYFMYVENSKSGVMKRSGMDVSLVSGGRPTLPVSTFGLFTAGLESMLGEEVEEGAEGVEATAGMSLDLLGVGLPPITFFTGQSGLLSAVWSAPSDLTTALQTNIVLHDYRRKLMMQNGVTVLIDLTGALSVDLSGSLSVSLWNKNAKSLIRNSAAYTMRGSVTLESTLFDVGLSVDATAANYIDFQANIDFYSGVKLCQQMSCPDFTYKYNIAVYEKLRRSRKRILHSTSVTRKVCGVSFPLPASNSQQCRTLLADE